LSVDDTAQIISKLKARFPNITGPDLRDICYATQNRQTAVRMLSKIVDVILVIGAQNSSNSNRLRDLAEELSVKSYLINNADDIQLGWLQSTNKIGITAGASAPEILVEEVINHLSKNYNVTNVSIMDGITEQVKFKLPKEVA
jgi:4-hydroxy-3-methylbut-2-enyl diphosphate reductase